jgi:hypothetical protein
VAHGLLLSNFYYFWPPMRGAIFFAYLCFLLLRVYDCAYTGIHHHRACCATSHVEKSQQQKFSHSSSDFTLVEDYGLNREDEYFVADEVDDEDVNNLFAKKPRLLSRYSLSFSDPFILNYLHSCSKASQPFGSLLSDKHITLRVLRI